MATALFMMVLAQYRHGEVQSPDRNAQVAHVVAILTTSADAAQRASAAHASHREQAEEIKIRKRFTAVPLSDAHVPSSQSFSMRRLRCIQFTHDLSS